MARVLLDRPLLVSEWEALRDPEGGRLEVLDGRLVVTPSSGADHNRFGEDLADLLRAAVRRARLDLDVTVDVEWRSVAADVVTQAPRGDVVVGRLEAGRRFHTAAPLLAVEIWATSSSPGDRRSKRAYWASRGLTHYWEVQLGDSPTQAVLAIHRLDEPETPVRIASGHVLVRLDEPFPIVLTPALVHGWTERESQRADAEAARADAESQRADAEAARAHGESQRADAEAARVAAL
ncbi:MAG: Uma2 family endonuclease, partial [Acidimicrobiia bacterium]|nr:Uma2 family endonuclease [Acidimicrobiia bacterium]